MTQDTRYGPIQYTRLNRSGGHIEYLIGVSSGRGLLLSSSISMPDNDRLKAMGLPITPLNVALVAYADDREIMCLQRELFRGYGLTEPEVVRKLKAAGFHLNETLRAPLDGWDNDNWIFLTGYALHGRVSDTAAALLDALRRETTCNSGLSDTVRDWLRQTELCWETNRKARRAAFFGTQK